MCFHVERSLSTLPRSRFCALQLKLLIAAAAPLSRHRCDSHHSCARRLPRFQRWLRLASQLNCHRDHIRLVHPHATTKGPIQHFPTPVPIPSAVHIVPEDIAQVDMVQGPHLRNALIPRKGAISRTRPINSVFRVRKRTPVRGTVHLVRVGTPIVRPPTVAHVHTYPHPSPSPMGVSVLRTD